MSLEGVGNISNIGFESNDKNHFSGEGIILTDEKGGFSFKGELKVAHLRESIACEVTMLLNDLHQTSPYGYLLFGNFFHVEGLFQGERKIQLPRRQIIELNLTSGLSEEDETFLRAYSNLPNHFKERYKDKYKALIEIANFNNDKRKDKIFGELNKTRLSADDLIELF